MRFQVLTAVSLKVIVSWDDAACSHVEIDQHFRGAHSIIISMMEAVRSSEMSVSFFKTT
jgi:hypothetical protein